MRTPLDEWIKLHAPTDEMLWKRAWYEQMADLRSLRGSMAFGLDYAQRDTVAFVISTHRSKSITLPVVSFERPDIGLRTVMRHNFHDWKLSVISEQPIDDPLFPWLFFTVPPIDPAYTGDPLADYYFEGFPKDLIFSYQSKNHRRWSACIHGLPWVQVTLLLCMKAIGAVPMPQWSTRPEVKP